MAGTLIVRPDIFSENNILKGIVISYGSLLWVAGIYRDWDFSHLLFIIIWRVVGQNISTQFQPRVKTVNIQHFIFSTS